ncbi:Cobalt-zinc-cadmium resistance protein CzcD [Candidatus Nitrotoga sp. HW29]|uniref:cation diffusion facilitator family transporter n=1 Tax=Candidatus Nitrotoga sp. HW29 TaxID=2886963 RepID=UPI001EF34801|nr:cation diffusion facilitator family transporter [Candidatus Nitrotoga sp. HW29]CAH1903994.1 Cobalt-zinc-cadmium resistance protein CzcD [Candidatus Nitrotoga sp. HW29]
MTAHNHSHSHTANYGRAFAIGIALNVMFVVVETIFGWQADSLALLSDAGHNLSDVLGLLVAYGGLYLARLRPNQKHTYGLGRATILAALFNAMILLIAIGGIVWEAAGRFTHPVPIQGGIVMWVAAMGVVINGITAWLFMSGNKTDLNLRGAFLHMAADALVSLGVVIAGAMFIWTGWVWLDPAISMVIAIVILWSTWDLLRQSLHLSLDGVPASIQLDKVKNYLVVQPNVIEIHDLHVWAMSTSEIALTVHLVMRDGHPGNDFLCRVAEELHDNFTIGHVTIQIELDKHHCSLSGHT